MTDALTHRIIDMIPSRGLEETTAWLAEYPNLKVIVRDGSLTYRSAADKAHPEAIQVGDRFHILKNVTEAAIKYLRRLPNLKTE